MKIFFKNASNMLPAREFLENLNEIWKYVHSTHATLNLSMINIKFSFNIMYMIICYFFPVNDFIFKNSLWIGPPI